MQFTAKTLKYTTHVQPSQSALGAGHVINAKLRYFLREAVPDCRASAPRFEDAQSPGADWGLEWKQSPVAGRQRQGISITDSLTEAGRLYYIKAFLSSQL